MCGRMVRMGWTTPLLREDLCSRKSRPPMSYCVPTPWHPSSRTCRSVEDPWISSLKLLVAADVLIYWSIHEGMWSLPSDQVLSCRDPHPIAKIPSDPRSIPYCSPDSVLTILWDSNTTLTIPLNSDQPPRPPMHYHPSLRTLNNLWEPQSHFCLHLSLSFHFSPLELRSHFHIPVSVFTFLFSIY